MSDSMELRVAEERRGRDKVQTNVSELADHGGYKVFIRKVENGFIVEIGCKTFVANTWSKASEGLELYFKDPDAAWKKYVEKN